jgi:Ca-activated chloride channel family protein
VVGGDLKVVTGELPLELAVSKDKTEAAPDQAVEVKTARLRIAKGKDEAVSLADAAKLADAAGRLRQIIGQLKSSPIVDKFEIAEEVDQLEHYAQQLEKRGFDNVIRKEMLDQAYQARTRNRSELNLRGTAGSSTVGLEAVSDAGSSVVLRCEKESGKLRIRVVSEGYDKGLHVQFPRAIREEGASYAVDSVVLSADKSYYRAVGTIRRLVLPGQERVAGSAVSRKKTGKASTTSSTAADLPTVTSVGDGILVQCVKEGAKLRARVVSDGYDPNFNMRFPRSVREVGILYVVDEVILGPGGNSYIACGEVKRLIQ